MNTISLPPFLLTDLVGDLEGIVVSRQLHVGLLLAIRADQSVHLGSLDLVQTVDGGLDLLLGRLEVDQEDLR